MPLDVHAYAGGSVYASPFIGPIDHTAHVKVDTSGLTVDEVDPDGYLKPGVPLTKLGLRIGVQSQTGTAVATAYVGNTGNGVMGAVTVSGGAKGGTYKLTIVEVAANAGKFTVEDPDGITVGVGTVGVAFSAGGLAFTLADGATDFAAGDGFNIVVTLTAGGPATNMIFGCTVEAVRLPLATIPPTNTSLGNETADPLVAVVTHGIVNRDIAEDNLGRAYTAAEIAAFDAAGCHLSLTTT